DPRTIYAATSSGLFKSIDGAETWTAANPGLPSHVNALAISSLAPGILYAGTAAEGVFKSMDSAASWGAAKSGLASISVSSISIDPKNNGTLYATSEHYGLLYKTTDGGATWTLPEDGLPDTPVAEMLVDPLNPSTLYAAVPGGSRSLG